MKSWFKNVEMPHVFTLLVYVILFCSFLTYFIPSGSYERETKVVGTMTRNVVQPGTFQPIEKHISAKGLIIGDEAEGKASPVSLLGFLSAVPRGMQEAADIIFFIFIIGGALGVIQRTGTIVAVLQKMVEKFRKSDALLTVIIMIVIAVGGSTLGMGEEFIPLVPIFLLISKQMGYDRIYGLAMVLIAAEIGFAAATTNPFTVNIAQGIAELPLNSEIGFRVIFLVVCLAIAITYTLRYGRRIKKDPSRSIMPQDDFDLSHLEIQKESLTRRHVYILIATVAIFALILTAVQTLGWWMNEMSGGFFLMGIVAWMISDLKLKEAMEAFVKGMEEMVVAALVVGFARGIEVVLSDGQILDSLIYGAANLLRDFHNVFAAWGMLVFQGTLNFFIPSGSGQAAVTMPLMAPLADVLGLSRQTAVFAFTCGDGFSNSIIPTSGVLMAMLSLAGIPLQKWWRFMLPLFGLLMLAAAVFLAISVYVHV